MRSVVKICISLLLQASLFISGSIAATASDAKKTSGFIDANLYPYLANTGSDNFLSVLAGLNFGDRLSYFSLTNFGNFKGAGTVADRNTFYTEQNLRWRLSKTSPLDLTAQLNFRSGALNDRYRFGIRWRLSDTGGLKPFFQSLNLAYSVNWHAVQIDHEDPYVWQLEHAFKFVFPDISKRLYLAGFADHTFNQNLPTNFPKNPIVGEVQLGYRLFDKIFAIAEYRVNQYRRADVNNFALGVEYKVTW